jgi:hypothetical protein
MSGLTIFITFLIGLILGAGALQWRQRAIQRASRRIPKEWPLKLRSLVNSEERRVWTWLCKVMFDQQVLIKLPVTRFTMPSNMDEAHHWYKLLNGLYCTFTVCNMDGRVVGCVDVGGNKMPSMSNQTLKHKILTQCGVRYWIVDPNDLPHLAQIRVAFLGEHALKSPSQNGMDSRLRDVADSLKGSLSRQRSGKTGQFSRAESNVMSTGGFESSQLSGWEQNSFVAPLDSRSAPLR